ncbi:NmrA family NAD(P)-binding protein [Nocardia sp. NBC_00511]|uniref:NmrA family NAD(P)-binding protein n=1 Tax=Nocardia sp. NBC_00511 TaxID=2903591 RepID=UPI0030E52B36
MSVQHDLVLVTGATGKQGGATARRLLAAGRPVRILVRDADSPAARELAAAGAQLAVGDFDEPDTLPAALAGAGAALLVPPAAMGPQGWDDELEVRRGSDFIAAARAAGVGHVVFTGVGAFDDDEESLARGKRLIEEVLRTSGLRWTVLRPARFMENYFMQNYPVDGITGDTNRHMFPPDRPLQVIAVDDVAAFAVRAFADPDRYHGRILELAGDDLTPTAAAALISAHLGRPIHYEEISEEEVTRTLGPKIGLLRRRARTARGWHADIEALRVIHPELRTLDTWLTESGAARLKSLLDG